MRKYAIYLIENMFFLWVGHHYILLLKKLIFKKLRKK